MKDVDITDLITLFEQADETAIAEIQNRIEQHETAIANLRRLAKSIGGPQKKTKRVYPSGRATQPSDAGEDGKPRLRVLVQELLQSQGPLPIANIAEQLERTTPAIRMLAVKCRETFRIEGNLMSLIS